MRKGDREGSEDIEGDMEEVREGDGRGVGERERKNERETDSDREGQKHNRVISGHVDNTNRSSYFELDGEYQQEPARHHPI